LDSPNLLAAFAVKHSIDSQHTSCKHETVDKSAMGEWSCQFEVSVKLTCFETTCTLLVTGIDNLANSRFSFDWIRDVGKSRDVGSSQFASEARQFVANDADRFSTLFAKYQHERLERQGIDSPSHQGKLQRV